MKFKVKSIHDRPEKSDGFRVYVERRWPEGLKKEDADVSLWLKEASPSEGSYSWFSGKAERWGEFECGYFGELDGKVKHLYRVLEESQSGPVTLLYGSGGSEFNIAVALRDYLELKGPQLVEQVA
ncbi:MAG: DUF488 family protein [Nitrospirota bacterium]